MAILVEQLSCQQIRVPEVADCEKCALAGEIHASPALDLPHRVPPTAVAPIVTISTHSAMISSPSRGEPMMFSGIRGQMSSWPKP